MRASDSDHYIQISPGMYYGYDPECEAFSDRFHQTEPVNFMNRSHPISCIGATKFHRTDPLILDLAVFDTEHQRQPNL
jgi:hypothetical protein